MIMKGRASTRLPWVGLISLAMLAAVTMPAWATAPEQTTQAQTPPPLVQTVVVTTPASQTTVPVKVSATRTAIRARDVRVTQTPQTKPTSQPVVVTVPTWSRRLVARVNTADLPAEGQDLLKAFEADRDAIQAEADKKVEARREALAKYMQDLQDRYTKAGKLDEAVAIRDYIRAGLPGVDNRHVVWIKKRP